MKFQTKHTFPFALALWVAIASAPSLPAAVSQTQPKQPITQAALLLQAEPTFTAPTNVASGTAVKISSSNSMTALSESLKSAFEKKFSGTEVKVEAGDSEAALKAVLDGTADLAAIGRPLTQAEKGQGLVQSTVRREKIAIVVGNDNPIQSGIDIQKFAKMQSGELSDWSSLGGEGSVRVLNLPETSDVRKSMQSYAVFNGAEFSGGTQLTDDKGETLAKDLGKDGIGYILASQASGLQGARILEMHKTLPTDERYPYSQPLTYVYKGPEPNPAVQAFLGYATNDPEAKTAIAAAPIGDGATVATSTTETTEASPAASPTTETAATTPSTTTNALNPNTGTQYNVALNPGATGDTAGGNWGWGWLLPLGVLAGLGGLWAWASGRDRRAREEVRNATTSYADGTRSAGTTYREPGTAYREGGTTYREPGTTRPGGINAAGALGALGALGGTALAANAISSYWSSSHVGAVPLSDTDSRLVLAPHHPDNAYVHWQLPDSYMDSLRRQGGEKLMVRVYDVTGVDLRTQVPNRAWEYECDEMAKRREVFIPERDRHYLAELGYRSRDGRWLSLMKSKVTNVPTNWDPKTADSSVPDERRF
jgi:phosphate transport system substrate-binding protein